MSTETRRRWHYAYRKRRVAGKVLSQYLGPVAAAEARQREAERRQRQLEARTAREVNERIERVLDHVVEVAQAMARATLLAEGYHTHRGEWRKTRNG